MSSPKPKSTEGHAVSDAAHHDDGSSKQSLTEKVKEVFKKSHNDNDDTTVEGKSNSSGLLSKDNEGLKSSREDHGTEGGLTGTHEATQSTRHSDNADTVIKGSSAEGHKVEHTIGSANNKGENLHDGTNTSTASIGDKGQISKEAILLESALEVPGAVVVHDAGPATHEDAARKQTDGLAENEKHAA